MAPVNEVRDPANADRLALDDPQRAADSAAHRAGSRRGGMSLEKPRRSVLYMPGANARALEKARGLDCDAIIFDLEDAVAPDAKAAARAQVAGAIRAGGYGARELIVRVNAIDGPWGRADVAAIAELAIDGVLFPKVESPAELTVCVNALHAAGARSQRVWAMIETPRGVLDVERIAGASPRLATLVMGTSDLVKELRAKHTPDRAAVVGALSRCVLAARAFGLCVLDGVYLDLDNPNGFRQACEQGRVLGFDGKTLIHPSQIAAANEVFGPSAAELDEAREIVAAWRDAEREGKGVVVVRGKLIENLHVAEAERVLAFFDALEARRTGTVS
jgi:citrate lyase subunit beta/citryl-CoA lyase